jgi:hypothetical protein
MPSPSESPVVEIVTRVMPSAPSCIALSSAVPVPRAVTRPSSSTVAMLGLLVKYVVPAEPAVTLTDWKSA